MSLPNPNITVITTDDLVLGDTIGTPLSACGGPANVPHKELAANIEYLQTVTASISGDNLARTTIITKISGYTVVSSDNLKTFINTGAGSHVEYTLPSNPTVGFKVTFINNTVYGTEVFAPSGSSIFTKNNMTSNYNRSIMVPSIGQKVEFVALSNTLWFADYFPNSIEESFPRGNTSYVPLLAQTLGVPYYNHNNQTTSLPGLSGMNGGCFDGRNIWIADSLNNRTIKFDTRSPSVSAFVTTGINPHFVAFDGYYIWVANNTAGTVSKIDTASNTVVATVTVQANPDGMAFNGVDEIWVANFGSNSISVINTITNTVTNTINLYDGTGLNLQEICFDGNFFWVTCENTNEVKKVNASTKILDSTISLGISGENPAGICFDGQSIWVASAGVSGGLGHTVIKINTGVSATIQLPVNYFPYGICFDGRNIWVGCQGPVDGSINKVVKINPNSLSFETYDTGNGTRPKGMLFDGQFVWTVLSKTNQMRRFIP